MVPIAIPGPARGSRHPLWLCRASTPPCDGRAPGKLWRSGSWFSGSGRAVAGALSGSLGSAPLAVGPLTTRMCFWLAARVVGSVATVPLAEELAFRGFLTRRMISAEFDTVPPGRFTWISFAVSSVAFGVLHDRWLEGTRRGCCLPGVLPARVARRCRGRARHHQRPAVGRRPHHRRLVAFFLIEWSPGRCDLCRD